MMTNIKNILLSSCLSGLLLCLAGCSSDKGYDDGYQSPDTMPNTGMPEITAVYGGTDIQLTTPVSSDDVDFGEVYRKMIAESGLNFKEPEVMLFLIIELVGSTGYSSIMYDDPVSLNDLKPHLETTVRGIIKQYTIQ